MRLAALLVIGAALSGAPTPAADHIAPDFSRQDLDHEEIRLSDYRGKVVLLNFWATWCAPCLAEMPRFVAWQKEYAGRGLQVVGISMDDDEAPVRTIDRKLRLNYPVVMGDEKLGESYGGVFGLPATFLIDRTGRIRHQYDGTTGLEVIQREVQELLRRP